MLKNLKASVERQWYGRPTWLFLLLPFMWLFITISHYRRNRYLRIAQSPPVPIIIIGNIAVGGTGKTPVIIALVRALLEHGFRPGVVARGYGGDFEGVLEVTPLSSPKQVGDEPLLILHSAGCPVAVGKNRVDAANFLYAQKKCDVILSDDGLQHYLLARTFECVVVDGQRGFGNGWRLPVGPLREGVHRLDFANATLINGGISASKFVSPPIGRSFNFTLQLLGWRNVQTGQLIGLNELVFDHPVAVAGIGNPKRFFNSLESLGFTGNTYAFDDHHSFQESDFLGFEGKTVLMTEKDATKCKSFAQPSWWALQVQADLPEVFLQQCIKHISEHHS